MIFSIEYYVTLGDAGNLIKLCQSGEVLENMASQEILLM
jgi:hypothetical protein